MRKAAADRAIGWITGAPSPESVSDLIEGTLAESGKADRCGAFCVVLEERRHPESGMTARRLYDAKAGTIRMQLELRASAATAGTFDMGGREISTEAARGLVVTTVDGVSLVALEARPTARGIAVTFADAPMRSLKALASGSELSVALDTERAGTLSPSSPLAIDSGCSPIYRSVLPTWF